VKKTQPLRVLFFIIGALALAGGLLAVHPGLAIAVIGVFFLKTALGNFRWLDDALEEPLPDAQERDPITAKRMGGR